MNTKRVGILCAILMCGLVATAHAQAGQGPRRLRGRPSPAQVQELFDRYTLAQARETLQLSPAQSSEFEARLKRLQDTRRRNHQERQRLLRELRQALSAEDSADRVSASFQALQQHDEQAVAQLRQAYADLDEVLDVRQRARFRLLEERLEQRKFELLMRARRAGRAGTGSPHQDP